jgi:glutathione S-transferase
VVVLQFPVLWHGDNVVPDSSSIAEYLSNTFPSQMALFDPPDAKRSVLFPDSAFSRDVRVFSVVTNAIFPNIGASMTAT